MSDKSQDRPGVIAHPPLIFLAFLVLGFALDYVWPVPVLAEAIQYWAGGALIALSFAIAALSFREFARAGTNVDPYKPTTAIIDADPFRLSRNPLYVGLAILCPGIGVVANAPWVVAMVAPAMVVMRYGVIGREERYLEAKFGEDYARYKASVRRWI